MRTYSEKEIDTIIEKYKLAKAENPDLHIDHCKNQPSLKKAVMVAANATDISGKIHPHQKRIGRATLNRFATVLIAQCNKIALVKDFDELLSIVRRSKIAGVGRLVIYDTAHRIGVHLNILPDKIYLHSGTKRGARNVLGKLPRQDYLYPSELPEPFQRPDIVPWELEDILCIYFKGKRKIRL
jgi:hypothetical protein